MRFKISDLLIFVLLFIFAAAFPVDRFNIADVYKVLIQIGLRLLIIVYYVYIIGKNRIKIFGMANYKNILLCIPFLLACFSNMIASKIDGTVTGVRMSGDLLAVSIVLCLLIAVTEEIVFRLFIHNSLTNCTPIKRILGSAGIFAAMHLLNLINVSNVDTLVQVLIQVIYDFGLGLLLGFLYEYSHSLTSSVILHFSFNLFNSVLISYFGFESSVICFYLTAVVIAVILIGYTLVVYLLYFKKLGRYFRN